VTCGGEWERGADLWILPWLIPVATPRFSMPCGIFTGSRGEAWLQPPFLSVFSDSESRVVAKADLAGEAFEPTDVGEPDGADRPSSAVAGGEPNRRWLEVDVYSLRTRIDGSTAVGGHPVIDEFGAPVSSYPVMRNPTAALSQEEEMSSTVGTVHGIATKTTRTSSTSP